MYRRGYAPLMIARLLLLGVMVRILMMETGQFEPLAAVIVCLLLVCCLTLLSIAESLH